jgi:hypothetical protein
MRARVTMILILSMNMRCSIRKIGILMGKNCAPLMPFNTKLNGCRNGNYNTQTFQLVNHFNIAEKLPKTT